MFRFKFGASFLLFFTATAAKASEPNKPWIRLNSAIEHLKVDRATNTKLAFSFESDAGLGVLDLETKKISKLSSKPVQGSYDWSPDGVRLFYREQTIQNQGIISSLKIYDSVLGKIIDLDSVSHASGFIAIDPVDYMLHLIHEKGVLRKQLKLPDSRLARWQLKLKEKPGYWIGSQKAPVYIPKSSIEMESLAVKGERLQSYDISADGLSVTWATQSGKVYKSAMGRKPVFVDFGLDPKWFHMENKIVYAGARLVGEKTVGYDLKVANATGAKKWITHSYQSNERWPVPLKDHSILYTKDKTTDLYAMKLTKISKNSKKPRKKARSF